VQVHHRPASSGAGGDLSLWNPETGQLLADLSGENSLGGSVTIESGVGTEVDRFGCAASLSTANAGFAGVGGGLSLSLSTGIATDGDIVEQLSYRMDLWLGHRVTVALTGAEKALPSLDWPHLQPMVVRWSLLQA
jgi:hypothetical protein